MRAVLLVSTYDLGRQPFGLASPAAWLRRAGVDVDCVDTSREPLTDERIAGGRPRSRSTCRCTPRRGWRRRSSIACGRVNPSATFCAYGLYAPLNAAWLRERGVDACARARGGEELVDLATGSDSR